MTESPNTVRPEEDAGHYYCLECHHPFDETFISNWTENFMGICRNSACKSSGKDQIIFRKFENFYCANLYQNPYQPNNVMILNKSWKTEESDLLPWVPSGFCKINAPSNTAPKSGEYFIVSLSLISKLKLVEDDQLRFLKLHKRRLKRKFEK